MDYNGGAPIIEDSPALDLVNTRHNIRTRSFDGIASVDDLAGWLAEVGPRAAGTSEGQFDVVSVTASDVARFAALRSAIRNVAHNLVDGDVPNEADVEEINRAARYSRGWRELSLPANANPESVVRAETDGADRVFGALAADAVDLFSGDRLATLRACHGPNCPLFFLKNHPRREWCSAACGTRARATRAYRRRTAGATSLTV